MVEVAKYYGYGLDAANHNGRNHHELQSGFEKLYHQLADFLFKASIPLETGSGELLVKHNQKELARQLKEIISHVTFNVSPESEEGRRIRSATRPILDTFIQNTHIKSIYSESYLNLVYTALLLAKNPDLFKDFSINTGFGGTADEDINVRLPAYAIPGLSILKNVLALKKSELIDFEMPQLRLFFAPYSAIAVNGAAMATPEVISNTNRSTQYLRQYIATFHPDLTPFVRYEVENPWDTHNGMTTAVLSFLSDNLASSADDRIVKAMTVLRGRGEAHGNHAGAELAHVYAAMHPLLFRDGLNHPPVNVFEQPHKEVLALSIGGRPERLFNVVRSYLRQSINPDSLSSYHQQSSEGKIEIEEWLALLTDGSESGEENTSNYLHLPLISTLAQTTVGSTPVYYRTAFDHGIGNIPESITTFLSQEREKAEALLGQERKLQLSRISEIERDVMTIINDVGDEKKFLEFVQSLEVA